MGTPATQRKGLGVGVGVWGRRYFHRDAEPAVGPRREGEGSVVCLRDALHDCQAEADACVVRAYALGAA